MKECPNPRCKKLIDSEQILCPYCLQWLSESNVSNLDTIVPDVLNENHIPENPIISESDIIFIDNVSNRTIKEHIPRVYIGRFGKHLEIDNNAIITCLDISASGLMATGDHNGLIKIWDIKKDIVVVHEIEGHEDVISDIQFNTNGSLLASSGIDKLIKLWDPVSGKQLLSLEGHTEEVSCLKFHPKESLLISGSYDGSLKAWNLDTGQEAYTLVMDDYILCLDYSRDGGYLVIGGRDIVIWDAIHDVESFVIETNSLIYSLKISSDDQLLAAGGQDADLILWNLRNREIILSFEGHEDRINSVIFGKDNDIVFSGSDDASIILWDLSTNSIEQILDEHKGPVRALKMINDGNILISGGNDKKLIFWKLS
jgi:WD40 repeat protein